MSDLDLLVTRLEGAGVHRVCKVNEVGAMPQGAAYAVLNLDDGTREGVRTSGDSGGSTRRLTVQVNAPTWDANDDINRLVKDAFYDKTLTELAGQPFSARELFIGPIRDPDGGTSLYALHTYKF